MFRRPFAAAMLFLSAACLPAVANASVGFVDGSTELHAGPDYDYPTVAVIGDDARVEVFGCLEDWSWCDVAYYDDRGWIPGDHLASLYEGRREPIAYIGPYIGLGIVAFSFDSYWDHYYYGRPWYRERSHWQDFSSHHFRPSWEGRHAGWDHGDRDRGNWRGRDNDRHDNTWRDNNWRERRDNTWRDNVRREDDRRQEAQRQEAQRQENVRRLQEANRGHHEDMMRGWREPRQREEQHQQAANPPSRVDNAAVQRQERAFQQHGGGRDWGRGMAADGGRPQQNFQRPQPQPQQHQGGGDRGGDHGGRGGGHGGEHGGGRGHDKD